MHFPFDTGEMAGFKHEMGVMHFPFDTGNFPFDTGFFVTPLFIKSYFPANNILIYITLIVGGSFAATTTNFSLKTKKTRYI